MGKTTAVLILSSDIYPSIVIYRPACTSGAMRSLIHLILLVSSVYSFSAGTLPVWINDSKHNHVFLRPVTLQVPQGVRKAKIKVTANQSQKRNSRDRILASYKIFVNEKPAGIGPGRGTAPLLEGIPVYDIHEDIQVGDAGLAVALHCYNIEPSDGWVMLEIDFLDENGNLLDRFSSKPTNMFAYGGEHLQVAKWQLTKQELFVSNSINLTSQLMVFTRRGKLTGVARSREGTRTLTTLSTCSPLGSLPALTWPIFGILLPFLSSHLHLLLSQRTQSL